MCQFMHSMHARRMLIRIQICLCNHEYCNAKAISLYGVPFHLLKKSCSTLIVLLVLTFLISVIIKSAFILYFSIR